MVSPVVAALAWGLVVGGAPPPDPAAQALAAAAYPWYDPAQDALRPVRPPLDLAELGPNPGATSGVGQVLLYLLVFVILAGITAAVAWSYKQKLHDEEIADGPRRGPISRTRRAEALPGGLAVNSNDPLAEARRLRQEGNFAGAILNLFVHQMLSLDRHQLARLAPGRTARQLVRSIQDKALRELVSGTLRQFEAVYYGHKPPSAAEFAAVWAQAEEFEQRLTTGSRS